MKSMQTMNPAAIQGIVDGKYAPEPLVVKCNVLADDRGSLFEVLHDYDLAKGAFGQVYIVRSPVHGTIRGFHRHMQLWDYFTVVHGRAKVVVARRDYGKAKIIEDAIWSTVLAAEAPSMVVIPPYLYHGWEALTDDTVLVSIGSEVYNAKAPDEERIPFGSFGPVWGISPK